MRVRPKELVRAEVEENLQRFRTFVIFFAGDLEQGRWSPAPAGPGREESPGSTGQGAG